MLLCTLCCQTQCLKLACQTAAFQLVDTSVFLLFAAVAASADRFLAFACLCEVRELVGSKDELLTLGCVTMTSYVGSVDGVLHLACECLSQESTVVLYVEEQLPSLLSDSYCEVLNVV